MGGAQDDDPADPTMDTHLLPVASSFFELYNPWLQNGANQIYPEELYDTFGGRTGVDLQKYASDNESPVWRLQATINFPDQTARGYDPDDSSNNPNNATPFTWRNIYFTRPGDNANLLDQFSYYPAPGMTVNPVAPGRYAVVGSATTYTPM